MLLVFKKPHKSHALAVPAVLKTSSPTYRASNICVSLLAEISQ